MKMVAVIPAYNEADSIGSLICELRQVLPEVQVVVVDDGSRDTTAANAKTQGATVLCMPHNVGIGGAVQTGLKMATWLGADYVIRLDGDGQHRPSDIPCLLRAVMNDDVQVAFGSRFCSGATPVPVSLPRRLGISLFAHLTSWLSGQPITDPTSGFMVASATAAGFLAENIEQDYPEVDARVMLARAGFRVRELPVTMRLRQHGLSSITSVRSLYYLFKVTLCVLLASSRRLVLRKQVGYAVPLADLPNLVQPVPDSSYLAIDQR